MASVSEARWQAEQDADTLKRAEEIKKSPARKKAAMKEINNQRKYIEAVCKK